MFAIDIENFKETQMLYISKKTLSFLLFTVSVVMNIKKNFFLKRFLNYTEVILVSTVPGGF